jgi:hypothetical protein
MNTEDRVRKKTAMDKLRMCLDIITPQAIVTNSN